MNRRRALGLLPWVVGLALLVWLIRSVSLTEVAATLRRLNAAQIVALIVLNALVLLTLTARWWLLLRGQGYRISLPALLEYRLSVFGLSYFTPGPHVGGEPLQVLLVEKGHDVPRSAALAAVALDKTLEFAVNFSFLLLGIIAIVRWRLVPAETGQQALGLIGAMLLLPLGYLLATASGRHPMAHFVTWLSGLPFLRRRSARLASAAYVLGESEAEAGRFARERPWHFLAALVVSLISWGLIIAEFWFMVRFLGVGLTLPQLVTTLTAARLSILLLLPAGLGALELSQTLSFQLFGLDPAIGLSVGLLIRARDSLLGAAGLVLGGRHIRRWTHVSDAREADPPTLTPDNHAG